MPSTGGRSEASDPSTSNKEHARRLLIIDDSAIVVERLISMVQEVENIEVVGQTDAAGEAIRSVLELQPDVVILDLSLVEGNGFQVLERIKKLKAAPVVIVLTNYPFTQYRERSYSLGADYFFDKSAEFEDAVQVLNDISAPAAG